MDCDIPALTRAEPVEVASVEGACPERLSKDYFAKVEKQSFETQTLFNKFSITITFKDVKDHVIILQGSPNECEVGVVN